MGSEIKDVKSSDDFKSWIGSENYSIFHFWASWAEQCQQMDEVIQVLSGEKEFSHLGFYRVEAEELNQVSLEREISAVPTVLIGKAGKVVARIDGAKPAELTKKLKELIQQKTKDTLTILEPPKKEPETEEQLNERIKGLIARSTVMLFMKGNKLEPKCGFSRTAIGILKDLNADFDTFDILSDDPVRQGLKKYSNWPTYPQLYVNNELIGGVDIIKEMNESGDLKDMLPVKKDLNTRLKGLINSGDIMIFMKGAPDQPKCGFSRQLMEILKEVKITDFKTFDIFTDEEVRQGLKKYSNWPTYPQVYVKGELIGGLDIIKELMEADELVSTLKP